MDADSDTLTLAFSLAAIERLEDPAAVFDDAQTWSHTLGIIDDDPDQIDTVVSTYDLRQDFEMQDRDLWFALEEICESTQTHRHVYIGASDQEMRVSTMFDWEYLRVTEAAEKAGWAVAARDAESGRLGRLLSRLRALF